MSKTKRTLLLPPTMKDFASCFSEHAVKVSDISCSGGSSKGSSSVLDSSVQSSITCLYRSRLSTDKQLLIKVTWSKTHAGPALSVAVDFDPPYRLRNPNSVTDFQLLKKSKGSRSYVSGDSVIGLDWDISSAKYALGPEPLQDFYLVVVADGEVVLLLGDLSREYVKKFVDKIRLSEFSMVSRREQVLGHSLYSTKTRFHDNGRDHEIMIRYKDDSWDTKDSELSVIIDRKKVIHVRRLHWNFRGNQIIFVDGSPVDMMWDVHDWWFSGPSGRAMFLFRTRSALESRVWLEEEDMHKEQSMSGFSLLIQAFRRP